jgi:hypothetical protein
MEENVPIDLNGPKGEERFEAIVLLPRATTPPVASALAAAWNAWIEDKASGYIWEQDAFVLHAVCPSVSHDERGSVPALQSVGVGAGRGGGNGAAGSSQASRNPPLTGSDDPFLYATMRLRENVEDEWFATWLLRELSAGAALRDAGGSGGSGSGGGGSSNATSRAQAQAASTAAYGPSSPVSMILDPAVAAAANGAVFHLRDSDGQYLLIEAADALPRWMTPETTENRVFVFKGKLHAIPTGNAKGVTLERCVPHVADLASGAEWVRSHPSWTEASLAIQAPIRARIETHPAYGMESVHVARCVLPRDAAVVLSAHPGLVSHAVAALYGRDASDVARANRMAVFGPQPGGAGAGAGASSSSAFASLAPASSLVPMSVRFSRSMYAQLAQTPFHAPKRYAKVMPPGGHNDPNWRAYELGMKLACGLEILAWQGKGALRVLNARTGAVDGADAGAGPVGGGGDGGRGGGGVRGVAVGTSAGGETLFAYPDVSAIPPPPDPSEMMADAVLAGDATGISSSSSAFYTAASSSSSSSLPFPWPPPASRDDSDDWLWKDDAVSAELDALLSGTGDLASGARKASESAASTGDGEGDVDARHLRALLSSMRSFMDAESGPEGAGEDDDEDDEDEDEDGSGDDGEEEEEDEVEQEDSDNDEGLEDVTMKVMGGIDGSAASGAGAGASNAASSAPTAAPHAVSTRPSTRQAIDPDLFMAVLEKATAALSLGVAAGSGGQGRGGAFGGSAGPARGTSHAASRGQPASTRVRFTFDAHPSSSREGGAGDAAVAGAGTGAGAAAGSGASQAEPTVADYIDAMDAELYGADSAMEHGEGDSYAGAGAGAGGERMGSEGATQAPARAPASGLPSASTSTSTSTAASVLGRSFLRFEDDAGAGDGAGSDEDEGEEEDGAGPGILPGSSPSGSRKSRVARTSLSRAGGAGGGGKGGGGAMLSQADMEYNLAASLAEAVATQHGVSGPASTLVGSLGVSVPDAWWDGGVARGKATGQGKAQGKGQGGAAGKRG